MDIVGDIQEEKPENSSITANDADGTHNNEAEQESAETDEADSQESSETAEESGETAETDENVPDSKIKKKKAALITAAVVMTFLAAMGSEMGRLRYNELHSSSLKDITVGSGVLMAWNQLTFDSVTTTSAEDEEEEGTVFDPDAEVVIKVPFYSQKDYPTGCELVSTSMLLAKYGIRIKADEIVTKGYLKAKKVYLDARADPYGPDPNMYFVGEPTEDDGYGCYSGAIVSALKKIVPKDKYKVVDLTGQELEDICREYIDKGIPVLYWGSLQMQPLYYDVVNHWYIESGKRKGEEFRWISNEHCMVLVGHNRDNYIFNDPSVDKACAEYIRPIVEKRFIELGRMAVAIVPKESK